MVLFGFDRSAFAFAAIGIEGVASMLEPPGLRRVISSL